MAAPEDQASGKHENKIKLRLAPLDQITQHSNQQSYRFLSELAHLMASSNKDANPAARDGERSTMSTESLSDATTESFSLVSAAPTEKFSLVSEKSSEQYARTLKSSSRSASSGQSRPSTQSDASRYSSARSNASACPRHGSQLCGLQAGPCKCLTFNNLDKQDGMLAEERRKVLAQQRSPTPNEMPMDPRRQHLQSVIDHWNKIKP
ncbi:hypothetical protein GQ53DRAFT_766019 [Thozetella sp. PMI_491]|nr:hypothetical protein GQ53DRAFT_766019 [Thozetella sp. PMI_491]